MQKRCNFGALPQPKATKADRHTSFISCRFLSGSVCLLYAFCRDLSAFASKIRPRPNHLVGCCRLRLTLRDHAIHIYMQPQSALHAARLTVSPVSDEVDQIGRIEIMPSKHVDRQMSFQRIGFEVGSAALVLLSLVLALPSYGQSRVGGSLRPGGGSPWPHPGGLGRVYGQSPHQILRSAAGRRHPPWNGNAYRQ